MATRPDERAAPPEQTPPAGGTDGAPAGTHGFEVHLDNFSGPFDVLLGLIAKHKLDITEVALGRVTDEFVAYIRGHERDWDLDRASEFLVVAATLLDLKAARLLPSADVEDAEDLELLEARDLLFARLLQYRAYKQVAAYLADRFATEGRRFPRTVALEPHLAALLPELVWQVGPEELARLAAKALSPRPAPPGVDISHLHAPAVSVREQAAVLVERLRHSGAASFRALTADADATVVVVARFLALLELFREGAVAFDQVEALGELTVRWTGTDEGEVAVSDDFDQLDTTASAATPAAGEDGGTP
ncbi:segregation and condensation protein A [Cellulomonas fimi]|uniref:Segregation and condensation protein A n=1 Tax=Cellulomonas fimi (strain ATCC 484 / DSM 20113 / JCM 1341 / CCUG 24087 / LMG 16345 / NBRC 15513 / NCIMB 8980 / NCTC 7547 / NRS-133) TaxID=590998 RepID=F4GZ17_CELFA|nr:chromosome segregation and condensation protein ScpA [Cellulomonas fimi ATCC 484]VEH31267.1 Segregation and condensation protein A [Cellulomonas fimi]